MPTTRWCIGGPLHGQEAYPTAFATFTTSNGSEEVTYDPYQISVEGQKREYFAIEALTSEEVLLSIRDLDNKASSQGS